MREQFQRNHTKLGDFLPGAKEKGPWFSLQSDDALELSLLSAVAGNIM